MRRHVSGSECLRLPTMLDIQTDDEGSFLPPWRKSSECVSASTAKAMSAYLQWDILGVVLCNM
jgi:hypothetical protein